MKTTEKLQLLRDVLENEAYCAARSEIVAGVLADARRRRARNTWVRRGLALAACVPIAAGIYLSVLHLSPPQVPKASNVTIVRTQPLNEEEIVSTANRLRFASSGHEVLIVKTGGATIDFVQTSPTTEELSDQELLDLFKGRPVALVSVSPHERHLILLDGDEKTPGAQSAE